MHNLSPAVGEVNGDRSNFQFGVLPSTRPQYGACSTRTDFKQRITEPRDEVKGQVARIYFYMHDRYGLSMSRQQQQLLMAWNKMYPVSDWERERDRRIARSMGYHNPFVTGERSWMLGYRPVGDGLTAGRSVGAQSVTPPPRPATQPVDAAGPIIGNGNSKVYHLPVGCPSYSQVSEKNRVPFDSEAEAEAAGYRRAGNCR